MVTYSVIYRSLIYLLATNAIKDILLRMDESDLRIETAGEMRLLSAGILEQLIASTGGPR
jgi:hypothetical protein